MALQLWDIEDIIDETLAYLKDATHGINAQITAINSVKSAKDTAAGRVVMTLAKFADVNNSETLKENENLFFFFAYPEELTNCDPIMTISTPEWTADEGGTNTFTIAYNIITEDSADGTDPKRKLIRYVLALRACLSDYLKSATMFKASTLEAIEPSGVEVLGDNTSRSFYSAGVNLRVVFA